MFFDIFRKKEEATQVQISFEQANIMYNNLLADTSVVARSRDNVGANVRNIDELRSFLNELKGKNLENEFAKGSKNVKDSFCEKALRLLDGISMPPETLDGYRQFAGRVSKLVADFVALTPRQMLHLDFFYKDDMKIFSKMLKKIDDENKAVTMNVEGHYEKIKKLESLFLEIRASTLEIEKNNSLSTLEMEKDLEEKLAQANLIDLSELDTRENNIESLVKAKKEAVDAIISEFSQIERVLRKYQHASASKEKIIEKYISSPVEALREDNELKIRGLLRDCIRMHEARLIDVEEKRIEKMAEIEGSLDKFVVIKDKILLIGDQIAEEKNYIQENLHPLSTKKRDLMMQADLIGMQIQETKKSMETVKQRNNELMEKIESNKAEIARILSSDKNVLLIKD